MRRPLSVRAELLGRAGLGQQRDDDRLGRALPLVALSIRGQLVEQQLAGCTFQCGRYEQLAWINGDHFAVAFADGSHRGAGSGVVLGIQRQLGLVNQLPEAIAGIAATIDAINRLAAEEDGIVGRLILADKLEALAALIDDRLDDLLSSTGTKPERNRQRIGDRSFLAVLIVTGMVGVEEVLAIIALGCFALLQERENQLIRELRGILTELCRHG